MFGAQEGLYHRHNFAIGVQRLPRRLVPRFVGG